MTINLFSPFFLLTYLVLFGVVQNGKRRCSRRRRGCLIVGVVQCGAGYTRSTDTSSWPCFSHNPRFAHYVKTSCGELPLLLLSCFETLNFCQSHVPIPNIVITLQFLWTLSTMITYCQSCIFHTTDIFNSCLFPGCYKKIACKVCAEAFQQCW